MSQNNYANDSQLGEIVKYISDNMKLPLIGAGGGFAPIGTINFFDASIAPQGWLACDGTVYNIADYPDLATYYASVHGLTNFYGGNGTTTFAVPDLRGEFLRGTGTNGHTNQGDGANVGVHQDGTEHCGLDVGGSNHMTRYIVRTSGLTDSMTDLSTKTRISSASDSGSYGYTYTSRPTNTSFLICVKYTYVTQEVEYSEQERVVGKWIDGKPIYEKTISITFPTGSDKAISIPHNINNFGSLIDVKIRWYDTADSRWYVNSRVNTSGYSLLGEGISCNATALILSNGTNNIDWSVRTNNAYATIQYTKTTDEWQTV